MAEDKTFTQADIDAAIEKAVGPLKESVDKLSSKNEELIGENRKLKRGAEIKPEDLQAAEDRADKAEKALADVQKQVSSLTKERDAATKNLETEQAFTQKLLIQDGLKSALIENGVKDPDFIDSLTAKFAPGAAIKVDGESRMAMFGDKPIADHIKEWAGSDSGKKFVEAPNNGGGGAPGNKGTTSTAATMSRTAYDALDQQSKAEAGAKMAKGELKLTDA